jgi:hypothetical protein
LSSGLLLCSLDRVMQGTVRQFRYNDYDDGG